MKTFRRLLALTCLAVLLLSGCAAKQGGEGSQSTSSASGAAVTIKDWTGHEETFSACPQRVVAVSGSLGEVWLNAGGELIGTTQDAVSERNLELPDSTTIVGTIKEPNLETILALEPDCVILSADITSHPDLAKSLTEMSIPCGLFHEEYFEDYLSLLEQFTALTKRPDLYEAKGLQVRGDIEAILKEAPKQEGKTVLLIRAYSSGFKAKNAENLAGTMLLDFGLENVLDKYDTLLEDISMEEILTVDPDYIFVTVMGSDKAALEYLDSQLCSDPAWATLTAIREGNYFVLPKDLFHYKPNARWAQAYSYLADILAGQN